MTKRPRKHTAVIYDREVITLGHEYEFWSDLYHRAMTIGIWPFLAGCLALFLVNNIMFATLFSLDPNSIANVPEPRLLYLFFFSIENFTTVGFGDMHPQSIYGHTIASTAGFASLLQTAALTGLIFAKFSQPRARIRFAANPIISSHEGKPTFMIRVANSRQNFITDATAELWLLRSETSKEGQSFRKFHQLPLSRNQNPAFVLSWTLFHTIDKTSLLYGLNLDDLEKQRAQFILSIRGTDANSSQELRARKSYGFADIMWNSRYVDILTPNGKGGVILDYQKFDLTEEIVK